MRLNSTLPPSRRQAGTGGALPLAGAAPGPQGDVRSMHGPRTIHARYTRWRRGERQPWAVDPARMPRETRRKTLPGPKDAPHGHRRQLCPAAGPRRLPGTAGQGWGEREGGEREGAALLLPRSRRPRRSADPRGRAEPYRRSRCSGPAAAAGVRPVPSHGGEPLPRCPLPHRAEPGGPRGLLPSPPPPPPRVPRNRSDLWGHSGAGCPNPWTGTQWGSAALW